MADYLPAGRLGQTGHGHEANRWWSRAWSCSRSCWSRWESSSSISLVYVMKDFSHEERP